VNFVIADGTAGGFNEPGIDGNPFIDGKALVLRPLKNWLDYRFYDFLVFQKKRGDKSSNFYIKFEQCPIIKALY